MANVDPAEMATIAELMYVPRIQADMGPQGTQGLKRLLPVIRQIHLAISTERMAKGVEVICCLQGNEPVMQSPYRDFDNTSALTAYFDGTTALTVQVTDDGLRVWFKALDVIPDSEFVGYRYDRPHSEIFFNRDKTYEIPVIAASPSFFGIPYFRQLRESLEEYGVTSIRIQSVRYLINLGLTISGRRSHLVLRHSCGGLSRGTCDQACANIPP